MSLNKSMHPRNRYKDTPPDFAYLASKYPEFQQHVHTSIAGRSMLNFKEPEAVRALTCTLLKEDFGLSIAIPLERLIPTVPLRLNYIHWVEDLVGGQGQPRKGIDIGTGASCIYPLLGATMNGWYFLATEVDDICFDYATKNVAQNNLSELIKGKPMVKVPHKTLLMDALKEETTIVYDFCMCNPPFFANQLEAKGENSRNSRRPPPSSVNTGGVTEIMAEGGELEFVKRIIHDSLQLRTRLSLGFKPNQPQPAVTPESMLGYQSNQVPKVTHTEFCQGRTMRWALAWSFYDDVIVPSPPSKKRKLEKGRKPLSFSLPEAGVKELRAKDRKSSSALDGVTALLEKTLTDLRVLHKRVPSTGQRKSLFLTAVENTWIHGRQKWREHKRQLRELPRAPPVAMLAGSQTTTATTGPANAAASSRTNRPSTQSSAIPDIPSDQATTTELASPPPLLTSPEPLPAPQPRASPPQPAMETLNDSPLNVEVPKDPQVTGKATDADMMETQATAEAPRRQEKDATNETVKRPLTPGSVQEFLFKCLLEVLMEEDSGGIVVEMHWVEGQSKDLMNQLCTYLKNSLLKMVASP
ncbi:hypothetical protein NHX12_007933 [Muraenolepis orangiensis]|uniref:U6 small nuclear RNA (adenine-(43)-N(6))-methyltransferase n=1 Tax=Muraenolepis orangiensis TaxID=630683 RepID=A0A9Q0IAT9_9TELE|nr:hypothetical protein NHX12_007933 [Muraenolepis orangiensis]